MPKSTKSFPDAFPGKSMEDLPELFRLVETVSVDGMSWRTLYRCKESGELWEEVYEQKGHGEVPCVRRLNT